MRIISLALALMLTLSVSSVFAHAIWIESSPAGVRGKQQTVRVYYGEYEHAQIEKTTDWYSDLNKLEVYLVRPDQSRTKLSLTDKGEWLEASFIPATEGTYTIYTSHVAKDLWEEKRFQFSSSVMVQVGKNQNQPLNLSAYRLSAAARQYARDNKVSVTLSKQGSALADKEVTIMAPQGWVKKLKSDAQGSISFDAGFAGIYIIEYGQNEEEAGNWNSNPYKETWQTVTTSVAVK
ncbi:MAG: hypothetical protein J0H29_04880 [Sphingobacteriales bacterium]|nr:hypothetical protein [Sphingobacteriales bacterium]OJY91750.1 MAG: hypothetical protein BGP14_22635 [Sphingobacteriales bacterium 44-15]